MPTGGRYRKLCFSPVLDTLADQVDTSVLHRLPLTESDYLRYIETITGIGAGDAPEFMRLFRFDPAEIFNACAALRASRMLVWRLLLSNEFALAQQHWPDLGKVSITSSFGYPLIDAFRILAECERASLIMRHLARARAILNRSEFLNALGSPLPLASWFKADQLAEAYRWIEYATFSSAALTDLLFDRNSSGVLALPKGYGPLALVRGEAPGGAIGFHDHPEVRKAMVKVFARPPLVTSGVERRKVMLRNDEILRWYGMTNEVLPIIVLDDVRTQYPISRASRTRRILSRASNSADSRTIFVRLSSAIRRRTDPKMQDQVVKAPITYLTGSTKAAHKTPTLERNVKLGLKLSLSYLPPHGRLGGAARFDPSAWKRPLRDAELWRMLLDPGQAKVHLRSHPAKAELRTVIAVMRRAYGPVFAGLRWSPEVERIICDLACALSPITVDPHIAYAIHSLGAKPALRKRLNMELQRKGFGRGRKA